MRTTSQLLSALFFVLFGQLSTYSQVLPSEFNGQPVTGFQDDFSSTLRNRSWVSKGVGGDVYVQADGVLHVGSPTGDPNHLLYMASGYDPDNQEVLARIRLHSLGGRRGIAVCGSSENGAALNLLFPSNQKIQFLEDFVAFGPDVDFPGGQTNVWYWLRFKRLAHPEPDQPGWFGKVWLADGATAEPDDWQVTWNKASTKSGFAGIQATSGGGAADFDVDYILIKADGLPQITPTFPVPPAAIDITQQPQSVTGQENSTVSFTVVLKTSPAGVLYQWQKNGVDISGANASTYTTPSLTLADRGAEYQVIVSIPGKPSETVVSAEAVLTVVPFSTPTLISAHRRFFAHETVVVQFSKAVSSQSATNVSNYKIDNGIVVTGAVLGDDGSTVSLTTTPIEDGRVYNLTVSEVRDVFGNVIPSDSHVTVDLQAFLPTEMGQIVNGFQDDFTSTFRNLSWIPKGVGGDVYVQADGVLHVGSPAGDPNHLLYMASGYDLDNQEVLARIRVKSFGGRRGIVVAASSENGAGLNVLLPSNGKIQFLEDFVAFGPDADFPGGETNVWFWLRLKRVANPEPEQPQLSAKIWLADLDSPEPDDWQVTWNKASTKSGFAGIQATSGGGAADFDVDYILIKADGLPQITPTFPVPPAAIDITQQPQSVTGQENSTVSFTVVLKTSPAGVLYQWQKNGVDIPGANASTYTTPSLTLADSGAEYQVIVSIPGKPSETVVSAEAVLTVVPFSTPTLISAHRRFFAHETVVVQFSKAVSSQSATNVSNYKIDNGIVVTGAVLGDDGSTVSLTTTPIEDGRVYNLTVSEVRDVFGNVIPSDSHVTVDLQAFLPTEMGQVVQGFQDDFDGTERNPDWVPTGAGGDVYIQADGVLHVGSPAGDPNHLLYKASGYDPANQEVLARIRMKSPGGRRGIVVATVVGFGGQSEAGLNLLLPSNQKIQFLEDFCCFGPAADFTHGETNVWLWLRFKRVASPEPDQPGWLGKIWLADLDTPEPADWQLTWIHPTSKSGFAGIQATSGGGVADFDVDYILIKADGLPEITPTFKPSIETPVIRIARVGVEGNEVEITWIGGGALESADNVTGPWQVVAGAGGSPYRTTITGPSKYFRVSESGP